TLLLPPPPTLFPYTTLFRSGLLPFDEPFAKFRAHGTIVRDGTKMSKSRGNVVNPDAYIEEWGADAFRTYLMFLGPYEEGGDFQRSEEHTSELQSRGHLVCRL